ncbi:uncharacterized protein LOC129612324 [Condylostylus longicornis]|uniref:uncharacterized protein LOC129612324 n=1 Tax=Condylostylus longicornis TaxID=2530218 RepID=UPI00244E260F|nr:uncharacterized protein LOC129612324 [Condylostylus longicornis]
MAAKFNSTYVPQTITNTRLHFAEINERETINLINKLSSTNSAGIDDINSIIIKQCSGELAKSITNLINSSIKECCVPDELKINKVIPVYKRIGDKSNYGFIKQSNTNTVLFDVVSYIQSLVCKNQKVGLVFFDLSKAFDSVDRKIMLRKLLECGVRGKEYPQIL